MEEGYGYTSCAYVRAKIAHLCPCLLCLTKVVCDKHLCDKRTEVYYEAEELDFDGYTRYRESLEKGEN
jgi:hypothetical protein